MMIFNSLVIQYVLINKVLNAGEELKKKSHVRSSKSAKLLLNYSFFMIIYNTLVMQYGFINKVLNAGGEFRKDYVHSSEAA